MRITPLQVKSVCIAILLTVCAICVGCTGSQDFNSSLKSITEPYSFSIMQWELQALPELFGSDEPFDGNKTDTVTEYFTAVQRIANLKAVINASNSCNTQAELASLKAELARLQQQNLALADITEGIIEIQLSEVLTQQGILNPLDGYFNIERILPPLRFELEEPYHLLVVSPRDRIDSIREIMLRQGLSTEEMENIEAEVDQLDVSSLVVELGGFAAYPSFVSNKGDLHFTIDAAAEEWLHQYLAFTPLGFQYILDLTGIRPNYELVTMNETLVGIVSEEIGATVYEKYYGQQGEDATPQETDADFDFNREMREIRKAVDVYLAQGEIEVAEEFMEQKRQYLADNGYYIRKLNQAYFAFHGAYADSPTSISPIGVEMKQLREQSDSLADFLETAAAMSSRQDLKDSIK